MTVSTAFDIGSTNIRFALGTADGRLLTPVHEQRTDTDALCDQLGNAVRTLRGHVDAQIDSVCVATTGYVDRKRGIIRHFDARDGAVRTDIPVRDFFSDRFDVPVRIENDANAAALSEVRFGSDVDSLVCITIGSGIGAGIIESGRLVRGAFGQAGEVGLMPLVQDGILDASDVPGAWEAYCSGEGIPAFVTMRRQSDSRETTLDDELVTAAALFSAARDGDNVANEYVDEIGRLNAYAVATLTTILNPKQIVFGGSVVTENLGLTLDPVKERLRDLVSVDCPEVMVATHGRDAALVGALALLHNDI